MLKLKKIAVVGAVAAGMLAAGAGAASASQVDGYPGHGHGGAHHWAHEGVAQYGLVNLNDINLVPSLGLCGNNVGVLGAAVPIGSPVGIDNCSSATQAR